VAEHFLKKLLEINPSNKDALRFMGVVLALQKRWPDSLIALKKLISIDPNDSAAFGNIGTVLKELGEFDKALLHYEKALKIDPRNVEVLNNRGNLMQLQNRYDEAIKDYQLAVSIDSNHVLSHNNLGNALKNLRRLDPAIVSFKKAISLNPRYGSAKWNLSITQLLLGDFSSGLKNYESRWAREDAESYRHPNIPQLQSLAKNSGNRLLLWSEQGYGDTIQFCRFIPELINQGFNIELEVQDPLVSLLKNQLNCKVTPIGEELMPADFQCPLGSLPLLFDINLETLNAPISYLKANENLTREWRDQLLPTMRNGKLNIGIACSGNIEFDNKNGNYRPKPLIVLISLLKEKANIFLIQKELRPNDLSCLEGSNDINFLGPHIRDFNDTAAIIENMDRIITIDTSLAHLSGALGKETCVLLPFLPDWRWLLDRSDSPWYASLRLIRQNILGDWQDPLQQLKNQFSGQPSSKNSFNQSI